MKDIKRLVFITAIILFFACNKNDQKKDTIPVYAGIHDSTFYYCLLDTSLQLKISWDSLNLYGYGIDELDIDSDGQLDLTISLSLVNEDSIHLINDTPDYPALTLHPKTSFSPIAYNEYTYTGMGSGYTTIYIKGLSYGERLDTNSNFQNPSSAYDIWREKPPNVSASFGELYDIKGVTYIGFKVNDNKYGWIKADLTNPKKPIFMSFAVQI